VLDGHAEALRDRPGFHQLEALVALREGNVERARERWSSAPNEDPKRPTLIRAALAMFQAELALASGEPASAFLAEATALGGESFISAEARRLSSLTTAR
jgi:hypothetical protein